MSASFWRFGNNYQSVPEITNILQRSDFTLEEILDDPEVIQELIAENGSLIEYLSQPEVLESLINYILEDDNFDPNLNPATTTTANAAADSVANNITTTQELQEQHASLNDSDDNANNDNDNEKIDQITTNASSTNAVDDDDGYTNRPNDTDNETITDPEKVTDEKENEDEFEESYTTDTGMKLDDDEDDEDDEEDDEDEEDEDEDDEEDESPESNHQRRTQIAAEILSQENWTITNAFMKDNPDLLARLWTILDKPAPLSMSSSTYFMKINEHLLDQHLEDMIKFILSQETLVDRFMRHIDNPPLMDFLLKVISTDKGREASTGVIDILQEKKLIPSLISFLGPDHPSTEQSAAADFLKAFITISANSNTDNSTIGPNELTRELVSFDVINELVRLMLYGGSGLANAVGIIIEIIRKNNSDYDIVPVLYITIKSHPPLPTDPIYLGTLVKVFTENIPKFTEMLEKPVTTVLETPFGSIEPLGFERFKICELVAELLHCSNMALLNDEKGESIVNERDEERKRLRALFMKHQKQQQQQQRQQSGSYGGYDDDDDDEEGGEDISRDIHNLDISENKFMDEELDDDNYRQDAMMTEDINKEDKDDADDSVDMDDADLTSTTHDDDEEGNLQEHNEEDEQQQDQQQPQTLEEEEKMIRDNPVVGDQLKIVLSDNNLIITVLNMFFKFPWNNFLHNVVFDIVQQVLNGSMEIGYNKFLAIQLFGEGRITKLIIEGQKKCEDYEEQTGLRLGYMGHLTLIAEEVVKFISMYAPENMSSVIYDAVSDEEWNHYVNETLVETREKYNAILGGTIGDEDDMGDTSQGLVLDPSTDNDIGVQYRDEEEEEDEDADEDYHSMSGSQHLVQSKYGEDDDYEEEDDYERGNRMRHDNDEDFEDEDEDEERGNQQGNHRDDADQFSKYMTQQMTNDLPDKFGSSDEDEEDEEPGSWTLSEFRSKVSNNVYHRQVQRPQQAQLGDYNGDVDEDETTHHGNDDYVGGRPGNTNDNDDDDDDDDYIDPNDDGQSYAKQNHPLYSPTGDLLDQFNPHLMRDTEFSSAQHGSPNHQQAQHSAVFDRLETDEHEYRTDPLSDEESDEEFLAAPSGVDSPRDRDDDVDNDEEEDEEDMGGEDLGLIRSTSKGEMQWDDDEQRRLMTVANYIQSHTSSSNEK